MMKIIMLLLMCNLGYSKSLDMYVDLNLAYASEIGGNQEELNGYGKIGVSMDLYPKLKMFGEVYHTSDNGIEQLLHGDDVGIKLGLKGIVKSWEF